MIYLLLAIFGSGVLPVVFRAFETWRVNLFLAIPVNYLTCVALGSILRDDSLDLFRLMAEPWIGFAVIQGILLAVNFYLLAYTAQRAGVAIAALASRLSVAIPSLLAFALYGDSLTPVKVAGLLAALAALYLCTASEGSDRATARLFRLLPILVFATFGGYFSILKYLQTYYLAESAYHSYVMAGFLFAFLSSLGIGALKGIFPRADFRNRQILAGVSLGAVNYLAVYSLIKVLAVKGWQSSQVFPIYSVGVVAVSALLALLFFREKPSTRKTLGLVVGVGAVALLNL